MPITKRGEEQSRFNAGSIRHGDLVEILIYAGMGRNGPEWRPKRGRAVMRGPAGWVLNMGGRYGTPGIATEKSFVRVVRRGRGISI